MNNLRKVKVKSSGKLIEVYKLQNGKWCDFSDCRTEYNDYELEFI